MEEMERITNAKNRVFQASISFGKDNPISLHTDSGHVYRVSGFGQLQDIINCGYVRPPIGKAKGGHIGEVFWTHGSDSLFYYDKRPVIETSVDILKADGQIGAISLDKLTGVWMFDEQQNKYVNNIQTIRNAYNQLYPEQEQVSELQKQISTYDTYIKELLSNMQQYMEIPVINQEISKVIKKNNELNSPQLIDSIYGYKRLAEIKKALSLYLEKVDEYIKNNIEKEQDSEYTPNSGRSI